MNTEDTNKDERFEKFEDLLEEYWNLAYNEGKNKRVKGTGETLRELHEVFSNSQSCQECEKLKAERDELAVQVEKMRAVLKEYSLKENDGMNGSFRVCCSTRPNEPHADCECTEALALPDISTSILNSVRAEAGKC